MVSRRRVKVFGLLAVLTVLATMYFTSAARQTRTSGFYTKTTSALAEKEALARVAEEEAAVAEKENRLRREREDDEATQKRLREAEEQAKEKANQKGQDAHRAVTGKDPQEVLAEDSKGSAEDEDDERSVAGRVKIKGSKDGKVKETGTPGVAQVGPAGEEGKKSPGRDKNEGESDEEHEVELELNVILKKSPIIVFSKSYCPYSRKAKQILLQQYAIKPAPYVVELDEHPLGRQLQSVLGQKTGRRTVPNVLINGLSIGGGDDVEDLHRQGKLAAKIKKLGGSRVTQAEYIEPKLSPTDEDGEGGADGAEREGLRRRVVRFRG